MAWTNITRLQPGDRWDYRLPMQIYNNLIYIKDQTASSAALATIDFSAGYAFDMRNIKTAVNTLESNITAINNGLDWINEYYGSAVTYTKYAPVLPELNRWIDFCQRIKNILDGTDKKSVYIKDLKMHSGAKILIRYGDYNG